MQIAASGRFHNHSYYSVDGGLNWTRVHDPFGHSVHRAELAFSPSNPQIAYAAVYQDRISNLYKSYDAGKSWILTIDRSSEPVNWMRQQGYHNNCLAVHPFDPNIVLVGGVTMNRIIVTDSHNGSPTRIIDWGVNVDQAAHVDHHVIQPFVVDSLNEKFWIFNTNDGGVAISENKGRYFDELDRNNSGYNTSQFYGIAKKPGESIYIGGTQDNGTSLSQHDPESDSYWEHVIGGDGFDAVWHKTNSDLVLGTTQYSGIYKRELYT